MDEQEEGYTQEASKSPFFIDKKYLLEAKKVCSKWLRKVLDRSIQLLILFIVACLGYAALLYLAQIGWSLYLETPVGSRFVLYNRELARTIAGLLHLNPLSQSLKLSVIALEMCLLTGAVCQVCLITRYFYQARGLFSRIFFWGLLCAALTAYRVYTALNMPWHTAFVLGLPPSLSLFTACFNFTSELLPELSTIFSIKRFKTLWKLITSGKEPLAP